MKKKSRSPYIIALALFLMGIGYIFVSGVSENSIYFLDVSEALSLPPEELQAARLFGTVKASRTIENGSTVFVHFELEDQKDTSQTLAVTYSGLVPDAFKDGAEVIVEGGYALEKECFDAKTLMTKCPSKYEKENRV